VPARKRPRSFPVFRDVPGCRTRCAGYRRSVDTLGKVLVGAGLVLVVLGALFLLFSRFGVERLPGDIVVKRDNLTVYAPIGLMIVVSIVLTIVLNLVSRK
jgi:Protein of unknown function (DUF2905)